MAERVYRRGRHERTTFDKMSNGTVFWFNRTATLGAAPSVKIGRHWYAGAYKQDGSPAWHQTHMSGFAPSSTKLQTVVVPDVFLHPV